MKQGQMRSSLAYVIFVLDKIQSLDHARWGSLQRDSYSHTTIRHSNKPRPWCRRTREQCRRNRHNRSCSCLIFPGGQQSLAMLPDMILDLSAGHGEGIGCRCG